MRFIKEAFESNYIAPLGPQVDAFEQEFAEYVGRFLMRWRFQAGRRLCPDGIALLQ